MTQASVRGVAPLAGRRVLVAEDEWFVALEVEERLQAAGATVLGPVPSLAEALALLDAKPPPDVALLDVNLGGEMAFPVADRLLAEGVPVVLATGYNERDVPARPRRLPRLEKPVDAAQVVRALERVMKGG